MQIAIIGTTGMLGRPVAHELIRNTAQTNYGWHITKALNNYPKQVETEDFRHNDRIVRAIKTIG